MEAKPQTFLPPLTSMQCVNNNTGHEKIIFNSSSRNRQLS